MTLTTTLIAWTALAAAATMSPGPDTLLVVGQATRGGMRPALLAVAGIVAGGLWYMALCGFGFLSILTASPTAFAIVKLAGAAYLVWLGIGLIRGAWRGAVATPALPPAAARPFSQGLLTNALNPKIAVFYLSALPQFAGNGPSAPLLGVALIAIHYLPGGVWLSLVAVAATRTGHAMRGTTIWRWLEAALGAAFIGIAGRIAWERN